MKPLHGEGPEDSGACPPVSMWKLDRLLAGELPEAEARELRNKAASYPELQRYLAETGSLKSNLTLKEIRKAARGKNASTASTTPSTRAASAPSFPNRLRQLLHTLGSRQGGIAIAFTAALGVGLWTWQTREAASAASTASGDSPTSLAENGSGYRSKGMDTPGIRIILNGAEYDTSDLVQSRSGDTLGFSYRSPFPIHMQIWYREDDEPAQAMLGPSSIPEWKSSMGWRRAAERVILEGQWKRQTIFVIWSKSGFTDGQARRLLEKGEAEKSGSEIHSVSFRLAWPD